MLLAIVLTLIMLFIGTIFGFMLNSNDETSREASFVVLLLALVLFIPCGFVWESVGASYPSQQTNGISGMDKGANYELIHQFTRDKIHYALVFDLSDSTVRTFKIDKPLPENTKIFRYAGSNSDLEIISRTPVPAEK